MKETVTVNRLPCRTWNFLKVNETVLPWPKTAPQKEEVVYRAAPGERVGPIYQKLKTPSAEYGETVLRVLAEPDSRLNLFLGVCPDRSARVRLEVTLKARAKVNICWLLCPQGGAVLRQEVAAVCEEEAELSVLGVMTGSGRLLTDRKIELRGKKASFTDEEAYRFSGADELDGNIEVVHFGPQSQSRISWKGALEQAARKIFRGTIDFRKGCSGSVGSEEETVLMLGEDAVNKTVPLILCDEEKVDGTHGATIGEMDEETLFYFESRGIDREAAKDFMARSLTDRVCRMTGDAVFWEWTHDGQDNHDEKEETE